MTPFKKKTVPVEETDVGEQSITISGPEPVLNRGPFGWIRVRAQSHLGEQDRDGKIVHRNPGDEFEVAESRAKALGGLVSRI